MYREQGRNRAESRNEKNRKILGFRYEEIFM